MYLSFRIVMVEAWSDSHFMPFNDDVMWGAGVLFAMFSTVSCCDRDQQNCLTTGGVSLKFVLMIGMFSACDEI